MEDLYDIYYELTCIKEELTVSNQLKILELRIKIQNGMPVSKDITDKIYKLDNNYEVTND